MLYVAENLKALRKGMEWTQEEMAEMIGVSPQSVSKWERGDTYPDITLLPALATLYRVSVDAIIGMDKINEAEARSGVFKSAHEQMRCGDRTAAAKIFTEALKIFPNDAGIMSDLAIVLALDNDAEKVKQAADLCERVLSGNPSEKVRHTTRAAICFIYYKMGEKEKALASAKNLPHLRESRESILAEFRDDPDVEYINSYIRFIGFGEDNAQDKIVIEFGINMIPICTKYDLTGKIQTLRKEIGANENWKGLRKLPHVRVRDDAELPPDRARVSYYADLVLDKDFSEPGEAADEVILALRKIAEQ
jgi:transcriptional regulator with XRE-family HTH domain